MIEITCLDSPSSLARTVPSARPALRIGVVQHRWHADAAALRAELNEGIERAARLGATVVFLPELTLSRYPADQFRTTICPSPDKPGPPLGRGRGPAHRPHLPLRRRGRPQSTASASTPRSTSERTTPTARTTAWDCNTAILVSPGGELLARTHKTAHPRHRRLLRGHVLPPGPGRDDAYAVHSPAELGGARSACRPAGTSGSPRSPALYSLGGAEMLVYPTAIGSEPRLPGVRHPAAVAAGDRRQRHRQRPVHGGPEPLRRRGQPQLLRFVVHLRPLRPHPGRRLRGTNPPCWSPTSTWTSARTGSRCSRSWPPAAPTPTAAHRTRPPRRTVRARRVRDRPAVSD